MASRDVYADTSIPQGIWSFASGEAARRIYHKAAADLTVLLRDCGLWNRPLTLASGGTAWRLRFAHPTRDGVWDPDDSTCFKPAVEVPQKSIHRENQQTGLGGAFLQPARPAESPASLHPPRGRASAV